MAAAIEPLRAEWKAQTGSTFELRQAEKLDPAAADPPDVDAIILPGHEIGRLAEKQWIVPLPKELIENPRTFQPSEKQDQETAGGWNEVFSLLRAREAAWGSQIVAVPFGSPILTCYYRTDLLDKLGARPPQTWAEYRKLAGQLADRAKLGGLAPPAGAPWSGTLEPLGPGWAGLVLIARAAPYVTHRSNYSALFKIDTMEPLIDGPPFVQALEELVAVASSGPPEQLALDPAAVRRAFWQGRCGLALSWPTAADRGPFPPGQNLAVGFAELPGSSRAYNVSAGNWETRPSGEGATSPLLGISGRMGVVTSASPLEWREGAFRLLLWLSGDQWNRQVSAASPMTTMFRHSDRNFPSAWVEKPVSSSAAAQYAEVTARTLSGGQALFAPRLPGRSEYLAALDEAVHQAVSKQKPPQEALRQAAERWREVTARLGKQAQQRAYLHSLGL